MARFSQCYFCGPSVQGTHRRWVTTGYSNGMYISMRGRGGGSSRVYTGLRTVCGNCAATLDNEGASLGQWIGTIVIAILGFCFLTSIEHNVRDNDPHLRSQQVWAVAPGVSYMGDYK